MHTNKSKYNKNLNANKNSISNNIKDELLNYLYNKIEMNDHKYTVIKTISDIYDIKSNTYYLSGIAVVLIHF